jgi:pimeloyl-ACP methyl ester carboxylesterase
MMKQQMPLKNGEVLSYLESGHGNEALFLIHGNLSSSVYYLPLIERLPSHIHVIAPDLRGFGDSSYHQRIHSLAELAEDIKLLMDALQIRSASVCGWSLGGGVAMEFAALYPESIKKLILIDSTTHKGYPIFKKNASFQPVVGEIYASPEEMAQDPLQVKPVMDAILAKNAGFMSYIYDLTIYTNKKPTLEQNTLYIEETLKQRNLADVDYALATLNMGDAFNYYTMGNQRIKLIKVPVLHFWGTLDKVVPEAMVKDNIQALKEQSTYIKLEESGHSPLIDKPDELSVAILNFMI